MYPRFLKKITKCRNVSFVTSWGEKTFQSRSRRTLPMKYEVEEAIQLPPGGGGGVSECNEERNTGMRR